MNRRSFLVPLALAMLVMSLAVACGEEEEGTRGTPTPAAPAALQGLSPGEPFKIGVSLPLSGSLAVTGQKYLRGFELAVQELNAASGIGGHRVELVVRDDGGDPNRAVTLVQELVDGNGVRVMLGPILSSQVQAVAQYIGEKRIPMLSGFTASALNDVNRYPYLFSWLYDTKDSVRARLQFALRTFNPRRVGILAEETTAGDDFVAAARDVIREFPGVGLSVQRYPQGTADIQPQLEALRRAGVDVIVSIAIGTDQLRTMRTLNTMGWNVRAVGGPTWGDPEITRQVGGPEALGNFYGLLYRKFTVARGGQPDQRVADFLAKLRNALGQSSLQTDPTPYGIAFDTIYIIKEAVERGGSARGEDIKAQLERLTYDGITAVYRFSAQSHMAQGPESWAIVSAGSFNNGVWTRAE